MQLLAYPEGGQTIVERLADGQRWIIPSQGRAVSFSTDGARVAWTAGQPGPPFDTAQREVWVSRSDGTEAQLVQTVFSGGFAGWLPDGRLLISGKLTDDEEDNGIYLATLDGSLQELARGERLRGMLLSPGGTWLAYQVTFSSDPSANGIWLVNTLSLERIRLPAFGAFRWRDDNRLLLIPLDLTLPSHQMWQYSAAEGTYRPLSEPAVTPFRVANGDWNVSPDEKTVAFLAAGELNIWLMDLPE
jgi:Tol biopolymer transport system component